MLQSINFRNSDYISTFDHVVDILVSDDNIRETNRFLKTLARVYGVPDSLHSKDTSNAAWRGKIYYSGTRKPITAVLAALLQLWQTLEERLKVSKEIARILGFNIPLQGTAAHFTRLSYVSNSLHQSSGYNDCILSVKCPSCKEAFLYQASVLRYISWVIQVYQFQV
jgi:hypothetical protein